MNVLSIVVAVADALGLIGPNFAYSCEGRWWALECWIFS